MTTIHLVYSSLEYILSSLTSTNILFTETNPTYTIKLVYRKKIIKKILSECCLLPSVIDNIIYGYTGSIKKIKCETQFTNLTSGDFEDKCIYYEISFGCYFDNHKIMIYVSYYYNAIYYYIGFLENQNSIICNYIDGFISRSIQRLNAFMKEVYNKDNYINCLIDAGVNNDDYIFFMRQNSIIAMSQKEQSISATLIKNYRKLTYLIVELKCIIDGIQRYFKTTDILNYCKQVDKN